MPILGHPKRREKRVKLLATGLSNLGVASVVTGLIGPLILNRMDVGGVLLAALFGVGFHVAGQFVLEYVVEADGGGAPDGP